MLGRLGWVIVYLGPIGLGNGPHVLSNGLQMLGNEKVEYKNMGIKCEYKNEYKKYKIYQ